MIEHIRLSGKARDQLITLKRRTGIENWNVLCRWAFCTSLSEANPPPETKIRADSNIEMTWKVFGGKHSELYWALMKDRCKRDGIDVSNGQAIAEQFRLHLHRGISYLAADRNMNSIADLVRKAI